MKPHNIPIEMEIASIHHPDRHLDGSLVHPELVPQIPEHLLTKEDHEAYKRYKAQKQQEDRFDCMITAGQIDHKRYGHFVENDLRVREVVKHNVTLQEAQAWADSPECWKRIRELEEFGRKKFGKDHWMEWEVCHFFTMASKDEKENLKED